MNEWDSAELCDTGIQLFVGKEPIIVDMSREGVEADIIPGLGENGHGIEPADHDDTDEAFVQRDFTEVLSLQSNFVDTAESDVVEPFGDLDHPLAAGSGDLAETGSDQAVPVRRRTDVIGHSAFGKDLKRVEARSIVVDDGDEPGCLTVLDLKNPAEP